MTFLGEDIRKMDYVLKNYLMELNILNVQKFNFQGKIVKPNFFRAMDL